MNIWLLLIYVIVKETEGVFFFDTANEELLFILERGEIVDFKAIARADIVIIKLNYAFVTKQIGIESKIYNRLDPSCLKI